MHTATHLLHAALRKVLGEEVEQRGSNITAERLRFDFNFERKMTPEEIAQVEAIVNAAIDAKLDIDCREMTVEEAQAEGAWAFSPASTASASGFTACPAFPGKSAPAPTFRTPASSGILKLPRNRPAPQGSAGSARCSTETKKKGRLSIRLFYFAGLPIIHHFWQTGQRISAFFGPGIALSAVFP